MIPKPRTALAVCVLHGLLWLQGKSSLHVVFSLLGYFLFLFFPLPFLQTTFCSVLAPQEPARDCFFPLVSPLPTWLAWGHFSSSDTSTPLPGAGGGLPSTGREAVSLGEATPTAAVSADLGGCPLCHILAPGFLAWLPHKVHNQHFRGIAWLHLPFILSQRHVGFSPLLNASPYLTATTTARL